MKYAIHYFRGCRTLNIADELIIRYNHKTEELISFAHNLPKGQRLVVDCSQLEELAGNFTIFMRARKEHKNFAIRITKAQSQSVIDFDDLMIPWFFAEGASTMEELEWMLGLGVSDVYVINDLGFHMKEVAKKCHMNETNVRIYPNVAQSQKETKEDTIKYFFVRPEDIELYEDYVDVCEFWGPLGKQSVLYDIYTDGRWAGDLNSLILNTDFEIANTTVVPYFGEARVNCCKRCESNKCDICGVVQSFAATLAEKGFGMLKEKNKSAVKRRIIEEDLQNEPAATIESNDTILEEEL